MKSNLSRHHSAQTAKRYDRIAPLYDMMEWFTETAVFKPWRELLWSRIQPGKILEAGVGTGKNIPFYPPGINVTAIDVSEKMMAYAKNRARKLSKAVNFQVKDVQLLDFPDDSFDSAVATFVFCSVPNPVDGLMELKRVVKPGGDVWLLDHVRVNKPLIGSLMDMLNPIVVRMIGANINRKTVGNVRASGLEILEVEKLKGELVKLIHATPR